jgi:hypothetical protein
VRKIKIKRGVRSSKAKLESTFSFLITCHKFPSFWDPREWSLQSLFLETEPEEEETRRMSIQDECQSKRKGQKYNRRTQGSTYTFLGKQIPIIFIRVIF